MFKRYVWVLLALTGVFAPAICQADVYQATYGVAKVFPFWLYNADGTLDVDEADGGTEVSLSCNQGAETTATNDFVDEGTHYSISLTSGEMQCQTIVVVVNATVVGGFIIQTSGHASAFQTTTGWETGDAFARLGAPAGASVSADIAAIEAQTDDIGAAGAGLTAIDLPNQTMDITGNLSGSIGSVGTGGITATSIATDAIGAAEVAADAGTELGTAAWATTTRSLTILDEDSTTLDLNATPTGAAASVTGAVGSVTGAVGSVTGAVGSIATGGISEASFATTAGAVASLGINDQGTAQAATGTTLQLRSAAAFADDELIGATCLITGGSAGVGQARTVTDYVSSTDTATVETWTTTPTGTITYKCFGTAASSGGSGLDAAGVRAAVGLASANLDTQLGAIDDAVDTEVGAIKTKTDFLPSATAGSAGGVFIAGTNAATTITTALTTTFTGNLSGSVGSVASGGITATSIAADAIGASEIAADAGTELGTANWATTTRLLTAGTNIVLAKGTGVTGFNDPTVAAIADGVWDEAQAGHVSAGTFGAYLDSSVSGVSTGGVSADDIANAVWDKATSGHTTSGTFGEQVKTDIDAILVDTGTTLDTAIADLPTNAELATALGTADDAVLTAVDAVPTNAELATALGTADDAVLAAIAALNNLSAAQLRDTVIEDQGSTISLGCALAAILAYAGGDVVTSGANSTYEDPSGTETRIAGTVSSGSRVGTITCPTY